MSGDVFGNYAEYYNLLYKDKDYAGEAHYIHDLIQKHCPGAKTILNLGCGTGNHDFELLKLGYEVTGVDMSAMMLAAANARCELSATSNSLLSFVHGDVRTVRLERKFDAVISLFHVMSYQTSNTDLTAAFTTVREHLGDDGVFVFDYWYGPAVLSDPPVTRVKRLENDLLKVLRIAEPVMHPDENIVDVNYQVLIKNKVAGEIEEIYEIHRMRYLFTPELRHILAEAGFKFTVAHEWMLKAPPSLSSWGACFCCKVIPICF